LVDPVNDADFWTIQEVSDLPSGGTDRWLTWWAHVIPPNHPPTLNAISSRTVLEDSGASAVALSGIGRGAPSESAQTLTLSGSSSVPAVIPTPTFSAITGTSSTLTFTPAADQNGASTITVTLQDNGGTVNAGADTIQRPFTVTVTPVNDSPT